MFDKIQRWWNDLSTRDRRLSLVALALAVVLLGYHLGLKRVFAAYRALDEEIATLEFQLEKIQEDLAGADGIRRRHRLNLESLGALDNLLIPEERENLAESTLIETLNDIAAAAGVSGGKPRTLSPEDQGDFHRRIRVNTQMKMSTRQLQEILHGIETHRPYLHVDDMNVRVIGRGEVKELNVNLTISGFIARPAE